MTAIRIGNKDYTADEVAVLAKAGVLQVGNKNDVTGTTPTSNPLYGPYQDGSGYGLLSYPGIRPDMYSSFQRPFSLGRILGVKQSRITNEKIGIMTGATAAGGENATDFCDDPPTPGQLKRCVQNYIWGKWFMKTNISNIAEAGEYIDYADTEKRILNLAANPNPLMPDMLTQIDIGNRDGLLLANELFNIGVALERALEIVLVRGNQTLAPANTQLGFIKEFDGLERQYVTGRRDLDTQQLCAGADSTIVSWGTGIDATVGGRSFVQTVTDLFFQKTVEGERMGFTGLQFAWVMSMRAFRALSYIWACQYYTYRCDPNNTNASLNVEATETRRLQLEMYNGRYLLIDGMRVPVIFSDGIRTTRASASVYTDDNMFLVPISWTGGTLLNLYYKQMDNADAVSFANFGGTKRVWGINNGMFLMTTEQTRFCFDHLLASKMRLIQEAPFLGAVINTIQYQYASEYRDPYPGTTQHYDGGVTRWDGNYTAS